MKFNERMDFCLLLVFLCMMHGFENFFASCCGLLTRLNLCLFIDFFISFEYKLNSAACANRIALSNFFTYQGVGEGFHDLISHLNAVLFCYKCFSGHNLWLFTTSHGIRAQSQLKIKIVLIDESTDFKSFSFFSLFHLRFLTLNV